ncbi:MAG TPA: SdrD B-like domain-containing protein [Abditibacteriaceae bacterium]|jgi:hypothetical protein
MNILAKSAGTSRCHRFGLTLLTLVGLPWLSGVAAARPLVSYGVNLDGYAWGNQVDSSFQLDDEFRFSNVRMSVAGRLLQAEAGSLSANWDNLGFAGRSFEGMKLGFPVGKVETTLFGGTVRLDNIVGNLIEQPINSPIYGVRAALPLRNGFTLSAAQMLAPGASVSDRSISTLGLSYQPDERRRLALELARSSQGVAWQIAGATTSKRLDVRANYRQAAIGFSAAGNPSLRTNRNGGLVDLRYRIAQPLSVSVTAQSYGDGWGGASRYSGVELLYNAPRRPAVNLFWRTQMERVSPQAGQLSEQRFNGAGVTDTNAHTVGFGISHSLGANYLSFQFDRLQFRRPGLTSDAATNRVSLGLSRPVGRSTSLSLRHILLSGGSQGESSGQSSYTSADVSRRIGRRGLSLSLGLDRENSHQRGASGQSMAARVGFYIPLGSGNAFGIQYRTGLSASGSVSGRGRDVLYLSYSRNIKIGSRPSQARAGFLGAAPETRRLFGKISGQVFEDKNGNGKREADEPGVPDVTLAVSHGGQAPTDANGRYTVAELYPGSYQLLMSLSSLPIEFAVLKPTEVAVQVPAGKTVTLDFPVMRTGQVRGTVFLDTNRNGQQEAGENGIRDAVVRVVGSEILTFTDEQGHFTLHGLPPKPWPIMVDVEALTEGTLEYESTGSAPAVANVTPNGTVTGVLLGIAPKERPIIFEPIA